ncbi:MAG: orotidine 5'-phosphate decarboxylase / HUMPS family protein [Christensenellaceae bacterium]|jgi:3-hexulose-6-phosphate synthase
MKIQYAIDGPPFGPPISEAQEIANKIREYIDIIELGEGMIFRHSFGALTMFKNVFPEKKILADIKIMDDGYHHTTNAIKFGADIVTVCATASENTIRGVVQAAKELGKESWVDFIGVPIADYEKYVDYINEIGPDYVCAHMSSDISTIGTDGHQQTKKEMIDTIAKLQFNAKIVLSGGITLDDMDVIKAANPHHVNIGSAFNKAEDPAALAKAFFDA